MVGFTIRRDHLDPKTVGRGCRSHRSDRAFDLLDKLGNHIARRQSDHETTRREVALLENNSARPHADPPGRLFAEVLTHHVVGEAADEHVSPEFRDFAGEEIFERQLGNYQRMGNRPP